MKQIRLRIMGGLGNQLYQYAAARYMQIKYNNPEILIDIGEYDTYKTRDLELHRLLHNELARFENKGRFRGIINELFHIYQRLYHDFTKKRARQVVLNIGDSTYMCSSVEFNPLEGIESNELNMYGYFVSAQFAMEIKDYLKQELYLDDSQETDNYKELKSYAILHEVIAVSIRCQGDYVKNGWPVCSKSYYQKGLNKIISEKYNSMQVDIFIFADDIEKVKAERWFSHFENVRFIEGLNVCESFELLRLCSNYVCSNSSFSWWGAFLSHAKSPMIVNPNKVFAGNSAVDDNRTFYSNLIYMDYQSGNEMEISI